MNITLINMKDVSPKQRRLRKKIQQKHIILFIYGMKNYSISPSIYFDEHVLGVS